MAAPSRPHHHATPLLPVHSALVSEPITTHATQFLGELCHVNERSVSDRRIVGHDRLYRTVREQPGNLAIYCNKKLFFTVPHQQEVHLSQ